MAGDSVAAGAYYERAVGAFKEGDYCLNYVKALQGWASLEAQARNATRARYLYLESVRIAHKVKMIVRVDCFFFCQRHSFELCIRKSRKRLWLTISQSYVANISRFSSYFRMQEELKQIQHLFYQGMIGKRFKV